MVGFSEDGMGSKVLVDLGDERRTNDAGCMKSVSLDFRAGDFLGVTGKYLGLG